VNLVWPTGRAPPALAAALRRQSESHHAKAQPLRGKWAAPISHNASFRKVGPFTTRAALRSLARPLRLRLRALRVRGTARYVWRPSTSAKPSCAPRWRRASVSATAFALRAHGRALPSARSTSTQTQPQQPPRRPLRGRLETASCKTALCGPEYASRKIFNDAGRLTTRGTRKSLTRIGKLPRLRRTRVKANTLQLLQGLRSADGAVCPE
jgi:hypothetical protein